MRAAPPLRRGPSPTGAAGGRLAGPAGPRGVAAFASAVGNRAFARQVARCSGAGHAGAGRGACCADCAAEEDRLALERASGKAANHDNPSRAWTDTALEVGAGVLLGPAGWAWAAAHAAASGAAGGAKCAAGNEAKKSSVTVQPVVIADDDGKNPTTAPSLAKVQEIWKKCCIDVSIAATKTICKSDYKTLDESPNDTPTAEETKMFADGGTFAGVQMYVPDQFAMGGKTGKDINGGGATYDAAKEHPKIVVVAGTSPEVVAHELGHATGHLTHDNADTVMKPTGKHDTPNKTAVSSGVCASARTGKVLTAGADDCCMDPK